MDTRKFRIGVFVALGIAAITTTASFSPAGERAPALVKGVGQASTCGKPGSAPCPLQAFMRMRVATPLSSGELTALAVGLDRAAKVVPDPSWTSWSTFARDGAAAARRGDALAARASCKGCHDTWRDSYRAKFRARPLPQ